jgi:hypothetical protein
MLEISIGLMIYSIINCFQFAAGILAKQIGLSFWRWFWIALFLPAISLILLLFIWAHVEKINHLANH